MDTVVVSNSAQLPLNTFFTKILQFSSVRGVWARHDIGCSNYCSQEEDFGPQCRTSEKDEWRSRVTSVTDVFVHMVRPNLIDVRNGYACSRIHVILGLLTGMECLSHCSVLHGNLEALECLGSKALWLNRGFIRNLFSDVLEMFLKCISVTLECSVSSLCYPLVTETFFSVPQEFMRIFFFPDLYREDGCSWANFEVCIPQIFVYLLKNP